MAWNPNIYNKFKDIRYQPFYDLIAHIKPEANMQAIDLGCGTGEQTHILSQKFPDASFLGIDTSAEMLAKAPEETARLKYKLSSTEELINSGKKWDLIFSNAALQWSDQHESLFPNLLNLLNANGQFAVQMPMQNDNVLNQLLLELVQQAPFANLLKNWKRESPVLSLDNYAQILFDAGIQNIQLYQKVYPIIANNHDTLLNFISGSALIPYMERLNESNQTLLRTTFKNKIVKHFTKLPALYAFKRVLMYGHK